MRDESSATGAPLACVIENGVARLTLDRPAQLNALSEELLLALHAGFERLKQDESVRAVVIAGAGKAFCAGHDLAEMYAVDDIEAHRALFALCSSVMLQIAEFPVPVIARVHGVATAAGCQLVAACDMAVAAKSARFATSGIRLGLFCSTPAIALTRNIAAKRAFEMLVTGEFIDADTALEWGLINRSVPDEQLDDALDGLVAAILEKSPAAIRHGKALLSRQAGLGLHDAYAMAAETMACNMMEKDAREGIGAFVNKRSSAARH